MLDLLREFGLDARAFAGLKVAAVFEPWRFGGVKGYAEPIVEHGAARQRALKAFAK